MKKSFADAYFDFLESTEQMQDKFLMELDPSEEKLLHHLGLSWHKGVNLTVLEGMSLMPSVSIGTSHRRLKNLRAKGFLDLAQDTKDHRVKYIVPTPQARNYFLALGDCLKSVVRAL